MKICLVSEVSNGRTIRMFAFDSFEKARKFLEEDPINVRAEWQDGYGDWKTGYISDRTSAKYILDEVEVH